MKTCKHESLVLVLVVVLPFWQPITRAMTFYGQAGSFLILTETEDLAGATGPAATPASAPHDTDAGGRTPDAMVLSD